MRNSETPSPTGECNGDAFMSTLTEAAECLLNNETNVAKSLLRDYVNATLGFQKLGAMVDKKPASLMRMLSGKGNPSLDNISQVLAAVREHEGVELHVSAR